MKLIDTNEVANRQNPETAITVHVHLPNNNIDPRESLAELESLANAANVQVLSFAIQNLRKPNSKLYIGKGKAEEIAEAAQRRQADVVIFDNDLSPAQIRELEKIIQIKVIDRSELILDIFATRASSAEARMQVELAQLEYTYPRLTRMWSHLDTVTGSAASGGVGTRGTGESQLEIDRRLVQKRIAALTRQIQQIDKRKTRQVSARQKHFKVSLVGYTNAGKSTLLNTLTGTETYAADQLFATLDTKTARWNLARDNYVLISDTVGFIRNLPHHLVASFRATLEETIYADLLLHIVDASHRQVESQIQAVNQVLKNLNCADKDVLLVLNKCDAPNAANQADMLQTLFDNTVTISARNGQGIDNLVEKVLERVTGDLLRLRIIYLHTNGQIHNFMRNHGTIIQEQYQDSQVIMDAWLGKRQLPGLVRLKPKSYEIL